MDKIIGEFTLKSDKIRVTDPTYEKINDKNFCGKVFNCKKGIWVAQITKSITPFSNGLIERITLYNKDYNEQKNNDIFDDFKRMYEEDFRIFCTSGQVGFFDENNYPEQITDDFTYKCLEATKLSVERKSLERADIIDGTGLVCWAGFGLKYGPMLYKCISIRNETCEAIRIFVDFITDEIEDMFIKRK